MTTIENAKLSSHPFRSHLLPFVDEGLVAGIVAGVATTDFATFEAIGLANIAQKRPMESNSIFWIASQTKPIAGALFMTLVDDGKVSLDDPVKKFLPEFANLSYFAYSDDDLKVVKPLKTPITIRQTLSHTSGLTFASKLEQPSLDIKSLADRVLSYTIAPLAYEPGTKYEYSNAGINTAGRIIEVITGQKFEDYLDDRLIKPLGMNDTTFYPTAGQVERMASYYVFEPSTRELIEKPISQLLYPLTDPSRQPMPAGGLFSTANDVTLFYRMLVNKGSVNGAQILSKQSVNELTVKQTGDKVAANYGLGFDAQELTFGHGGACGSLTTAERARGIIKVWLVQHDGFEEGVRQNIDKAFESAVEEALASSNK